MTALVISRASEHVVSARQIHAQTVSSLLRCHQFGQQKAMAPYCLSLCIPQTGVEYPGPR